MYSIIRWRKWYGKQNNWQN